MVPLLRNYCQRSAPRTRQQTVMLQGIHSYSLEAMAVAIAVAMATNDRFLWRTYVLGGVQWH